MKKKLAVIVTGLTASGKTDLALALARRIKGKIITADATQLVKQISVVNNKVDEKLGVGLLGSVDAFFCHSAFDYVRAATRETERISAEQGVPIIEGGSIFYLLALLGGRQVLFFAVFKREGSLQR